MNFTGNSANVEKWYEQVKRFTADSRLLKIDDVARNWLILKTYEVLCEKVDYFGEYHSKPSVSVPDAEQIKSTLIQQIDTLLAGDTLFLRTNLCSPKDVQRDCRVSSGREALDLLTASYRLYEGYPRMKDEELYLVFRQWIPNIEKEFRCFVANGNVIGISQYDDSDTVLKRDGASEVYDWREEDYVSLYRYLENVIQETHIEFAVVDIASTPSGYWLLEINPFHRSTDKCLFYYERIYEEWEREEVEIRYWLESHTFQKLFVNQEGKIIRKEQDTIQKNEVDFSKLILNLKGLS